jgi:hypothetical protein
MEHVSGIASGLFTIALLGMAAVLVARKRKHLKLVCRVIDRNDHRIVGFLDQLVASGQLAPAPLS